MTIRPQPWSTIAPTYACVTCSTAPRLRRIASSQSSGCVSTKSFSSPNPVVGMPALLTRMSTGPVASRMRVILSGLVTSAFTGRACCVAAEVGRDRRGAVLEDVVDPHERARAHERRADLGADAVAAAGHERAPTREIDVDAHARSDFHDDGDHRGPAAGALVDEAGERLAAVAAHRLEVGGALARRLRDRLAHDLLGVLEQILGFGRVDPAPGDDLGTGDDLAGRRSRP